MESARDSLAAALRMGRMSDPARQVLNQMCLIAGIAALLVASTATASQMDDSEKAAAMDALLDYSRLHEGRPLGVPQSYDWFARPIMKQGNNPGPNKAMIGWGHVFWAQYSGQAGSELQLRNLRVYLCSGSLGRWRLVQSGEIYGREFDADFKHVSRQALKMHASNGELTVAFSWGSAFHFWPRMDRLTLPDEPLCGVIVTVQARRLPTPDVDEADTGHYLIGLGADYWRDRTAKWNGKDSNPGIALGRLKYVTDDWRWHALNTASVNDTKRLLSEGFDTQAPSK